MKRILMLVATVLMLSILLSSCTIPFLPGNTPDTPDVPDTPDIPDTPGTPAEPIYYPVDPASFGKADILYFCDDGSLLCTYNDKSLEDYEGVCVFYKNDGYTVYSSNDMGGNLATTLVKDEAMAHVYWHSKTGELNIVTSATAGASLPVANPEVTDGDYECTVVQMQDTIRENGMGYIIQLKDGSYIVYDGAYSHQADKIESYLLSNYKGEGKPIIRAWVLTHSHDDHTPTFSTLSNRADKFVVENIIVAPMNDEVYAPRNNEEKYLPTTFYTDAAKFEGANIVFAHTGMTFKFCNLNMEIIYSPESYYKTTTDLGNFNNTSIVSRLYDDDYSALFNADVGIEGSTIIENLYGRYIESDMCQISHHGVEDVPLTYYDKVNASILFYPCNRWLYDQTDRHYEERKEMENWDCTKEILIAELGQYVRAWGTRFDKDAELSIPDYVK